MRMTAWKTTMASTIGPKTPIIARGISVTHMTPANTCSVRLFFSRSVRSLTVVRASFQYDTTSSKTPIARSSQSMGVLLRTAMMAMVGRVLTLTLALACPRASELRLEAGAMKRGKRCFEVLDVVYSIVRRHKQSGSFASHVYRCGICQWRLAMQTKEPAIATYVTATVRRAREHLQDARTR